MDANSSFLPKNENAKKMWSIVMTTPIWKWQKCHCEMKNIQKNLAEVIHINFAKMSTVTHLVMMGRHSYDT